MWDASSGTRAPEDGGSRVGVAGVAILPDNKSVVSAGGDQRCPRVDAGGRACFRRASGADPWRGRLPNGVNFVTASADKSIKVFDLKTGNEVRTIAGHTGAVKAVAVSKDGAKILSGSDDKTFRVWNVADGKPLMTLPPLPAGVTAVAAASDNALAAAGLADGVVKVYDLTKADAAKAERATSRARARP